MQVSCLNHQGRRREKVEENPLGDKAIASALVTLTAQHGTDGGLRVLRRCSLTKWFHAAPTPSTYASRPRLGGIVDFVQRIIIVSTGRLTVVVSRRESTPANRRRPGHLRRLFPGWSRAENLIWAQHHSTALDGRKAVATCLFPVLSGRPMQELVDKLVLAEAGDAVQCFPPKSA